MSLQRFYGEGFTYDTTTTFVDMVEKKMAIQGCQVKLQVWDTAGAERFSSITQQFYRGANGILVVYDCTSPHSFTQLGHWIASIRGCEVDIIENARLLE